MRLDLQFVEKLKEKLELRGLNCQISDVDVCKGFIVRCDSGLEWNELVKIMEEVAGELGGKLEDNSPDDEIAWYIAWFANATLDIYPHLIAVTKEKNRLEVEICSEY